MDKSIFDRPENFTNRELSWLEFNQRILGEARDRKNPLFERMKFLSITASNLDEFFMVRIASLKDMVNAGYKKKDIAGMTPQEQLGALNEKTHAFCEKQYTTYNRSLLPKLSEAGLEIVTFNSLSEKEEEFLEEYFHKNVYPVLTPMAIDSSRPFPLIQNKTLNIAALIKSRGEDKKEKKDYDIATVQVPSVLPRVIVLPQKDGGKRKCRVILLENVIEHYLDVLFLNHEIICSAPYRIMRNADLSIDEDDAEDLLKEIEKQAAKRDLEMPVLIQVNIAKEESKHGFEVEEIDEVFNSLKDYPHVKVRGLMMMAPHIESSETEKYFKMTQELLQRLQKDYPMYQLDQLSMGMSNDYHEALKHGSTMIRIGSALFK